MPSERRSGCVVVSGQVRDGGNLALLEKARAMSIHAPSLRVRERYRVLCDLRKFAVHDPCSKTGPANCNTVRRFFSLGQVFGTYLVT